MAPERHRLGLFVACTAVAGTAAVAWAFPPVSLVHGLAVIATFALFEATATRLRDDVQMSLTNVVVLVAILVGGTALAFFAAVRKTK